MRFGETVAAKFSGSNARRSVQLRICKQPPSIYHPPTGHWPEIAAPLIDMRSMN
jgi:hypothetical protein